MSFKYEYKETEIGTIPSGWDIKSLGNSLYIKGRIGWKGLKKNEYLEDGDFRIINGANIVDNKIDWEKCGFITEERYNESPEIMLQKDDIVMTKDGTIGKVAIVKTLDIKTTVASGLFVIRTLSEDIDVDYLYYYFNSNHFKGLVNSRIEGSVIPHLYQRDLIELKIPFPKIDEQKKISKLLRSLDNKIDLNNEINKTLEEMAQALFKRWFIDFEFPNEDGEPYKSSGGEMVQSNLGMIPNKWNISSLEDFAKFRSGKSIKKEFRDENGKFNIYGSNGIIGKTNEVLLSESCLIIGRVGAYCGSIQLSTLPCWVTDNALIAISNNRRYIPFLHSILLKSALREKAGGSAQPLINQSILNSIEFILPKEEILDKYCEIIDKYNKIIVENEIENKQLMELRDSLLPKLMSGEIKVDDIEANL